MTTLPISDIVRINTIISPVAPPARARKTLMLTEDDTLDAGGSGKVKSYGNLTEVGADFATSSEPYKAAQTYFAQSPFPRTLAVGRWTDVLVNTEVRGGAPAAIADISGSQVNDGSFRVAGQDITGITFAANATYAQVAAAVQTALQTVFATATCQYVAADGRFVLAFPPTTAITGVAEDAATGTALADLLGLTAGEGATLHLGSAAETIAEALAEILALDSAIYFIFLDAPLNDNAAMTAASAWAQASRVFLSLESNQLPEASAAVAVQREALVAVEPRRTLMSNTGGSQYMAASPVARLSAVNYAAPNSVTTLKFRTLPNVSPDGYSRSQVEALRGKNINFYVRYGGESTYAEGVMMDGGWADEVAWLDWFVAEVERDVFGHLRRAPKVPLTNAGLQALRNTVEGPCRMGVANGGLAPNNVSDELTRVIRDTTGDQNFDGRLSAGYLIWVPPISSLSQSQRDNRELPPFKIWGKGAGAVHGFEADFTFER